MNFQLYAVVMVPCQRWRKVKQQKLKELKSEVFLSYQVVSSSITREATSKTAGSPVRCLLISQLAARWQCEHSQDASDLPSVNYTSPRRRSSPSGHLRSGYDVISCCAVCRLGRVWSTENVSHYLHFFQYNTELAIHHRDVQLCKLEFINSDIDTVGKCPLKFLRGDLMDC